VTRFTVSDPSQITLTTVQVSLILGRISGDLMIPGELAKVRTGLSPVIGAAGEDSMYGMSAASVAGAPELQQLAQSVPCNFDEAASRILGIHALVAGAGFDKLTEYLRDHLGQVGSDRLAAYARLAAGANIVSAWLKLLAIVNSYRGEISMVGVDNPAPPLVRTKSVYDELYNATLTGKGQLDLGRLELANCLRAALVSTTGIDFDVPTSGPLAGSEVQWYLRKGGDIVQFYSADGGNAFQMQADENGVTRNGIQGKHQPVALDKTALPVTKSATVKMCIQAEKGGITKNLVDAAATAWGGPAALVGSALTSMLLRWDCLLGTLYSFDVTDWEYAWLVRFQVETSTSVAYSGSQPFSCYGHALLKGRSAP
jgi:hypothetical protein